VGEPFVGKAGELLTAAITKGLKLAREEVYICNVVKCRPPDNRNPLPDEIAQCRGYLEAQLRMIRPNVIVTLGGPAMQVLTGEEGGITKLRGRWKSWNEIPLMPTFHPAYILRNPSAKREFWDDLQLVMQQLGIEPRRVLNE
jgi:uracil-DNA glycosylase family 4